MKLNKGLELINLSEQLLFINLDQRHWCILILKDVYM